MNQLKREKIVSDYEELIKVKEFHGAKNYLAQECTYQSILKTLQSDFDTKIKDKLDRWISISNARYFKYSKPVINYFQAKMLYRDGYYEAAITLSRAICEMICSDYLSNQPHPFGSFENLEMENFRTLVKFLALPKKISKKDFDEGIIPKINSLDDRNLMSSSYEFDSKTNTYIFKNENGKNPRNLNRLLAALSEVNFIERDNFPVDTFELINEVYDDGNTYVHARKSTLTSKENAINCLNKIGYVLAHLYLVNGALLGKEIVSGYTEFPDICSGVHYSLDAYATPEDAMRGYYNLPSPHQYKKMLSLKGDWECVWKNKESKTQTALLSFTVDGEYLHAKFHSSKLDCKNILIKLFGDYFHLICFDSKKVNSKKKPIAHFEFEFLDDRTVLGSDLLTGQKALLKRT